MVVVVGVGVWVGSWVVVGLLVVVSSLGVGVGSCVGVGSLDVGSWLGVGSSLGVGVGVVSTSCVGGLWLGSSWLDVLAHEARANAIAPTIDRANELDGIFQKLAILKDDDFKIVESLIDHLNKRS